MSQCNVVLWAHSWGPSAAAGHAEATPDPGSFSPPALPPPAPRLTNTVTDTHARSLRIMPHTVFRLTLPAPLQPAVFRGQLHLVPGNRAKLEVTVLDGDSPVWNRKIDPGSAAIPLSLNLPAGRDLTLKVAFDGPLAFPCGIDLRDAHVIRRAN